ncbi:energy transducer TonB [Plesiomonas shigelloides]|uniref:energy transducer TonB n=1 Tax=Plesiomonas shigelloides TaxID=703 RepID=UPI0007ECB282|nr:energy transducer TonB [Plesiomonas shigelloides]KAB7678861.1 TonB family protein [Plesiomonas shigelloides]KAB7685481.1 TonB family protein [Plesiomonas shigelloides]MCQ8857605.1 TonB family protein [Plesiomonas shigelloides]SBT60795.1 transport protein TonB [Plesiomonas shigelloides]
MPLTLLTAGAHLRRNKRLLLASGLCMSAHAALLLFGLQPTQTRAVTLVSLSAGPALVLNLAATGAQSGAAADVQPAPQKTEPKKVVDPSAVPAKAAETAKTEQAKPKQAKPVLKKEPAPKKIAPKIPEEKAPKKTVKKTARKSTDNTEQHNPVAANTSTTAAHSLATTQSAGGAPNTASRAAPASTAQARGSSSEPRFRVPPSAPEYPKASRMRRQEGTVLLEVKLGTQGEQLQVVLLKSSGFPLLDRSALKAVKGWQFLPQEINGQGVSHVVRIPVRFELT